MRLVEWWAVRGGWFADDRWQMVGMDVVVGCKKGAEEVYLVVFVSHDASNDFTFCISWWDGAPGWPRKAWCGKQFGSHLVPATCQYR